MQIIRFRVQQFAMIDLSVSNLARLLGVCMNTHSLPHTCTALKHQGWIESNNRVIYEPHKLCVSLRSSFSLLS